MDQNNTVMTDNLFTFCHVKIRFSAEIFVFKSLTLLCIQPALALKDD